MRSETDCQKEDITRNRILSYDSAVHSLLLTTKDEQDFLQIVDTSGTPYIADVALDPVLEFIAARSFGRSPEHAEFPIVSIKGIFKNESRSKLRVLLLDESDIREVLMQLLLIEGTKLEPELKNEDGKPIIFKYTISSLFEDFQLSRRTMLGLWSLFEKRRLSKMSDDKIQMYLEDKRYQFRDYILKQIESCGVTELQRLVSDLIWERTGLWDMRKKAIDQSRGKPWKIRLDTDIGDRVVVSEPEPGQVEFKHEYVFNGITHVAINVSGNHAIKGYGSLFAKPPFRITPRVTKPIEHLPEILEKICRRGIPINFTTSGDRLIIEGIGEPVDVTVEVPLFADLSGKGKIQFVSFPRVHEGNITIDNLRDPCIRVVGGDVHGDLIKRNVSSPLTFGIVSGKVVSREK